VGASPETTAVMRPSRTRMPPCSITWPLPTMILAFVITRFCACDRCAVQKIDKTPAANRDATLVNFRAPCMLFGRALDEEDRILSPAFLVTGAASLLATWPSSNLTPNRKPEASLNRDPSYREIIFQLVHRVVAPAGYEVIEIIVCMSFASRLGPRLWPASVWHVH